MTAMIGSVGLLSEPLVPRPHVSIRLADYEGLALVFVGTKWTEIRDCAYQVRIVNVSEEDAQDLHQMLAERTYVSRASGALDIQDYTTEIQTPDLTPPRAWPAGCRLDESTCALLYTFESGWQLLTFSRVHA